MGMRRYDLDSRLESKSAAIFLCPVAAALQAYKLSDLVLLVLYSFLSYDG